ncbi:MAG: tRNA (adenosine(37)-N6)-dimethylallyltransferase MiaA [Candidatus Omnitrophota bacterium]
MQKIIFIVGPTSSGKTEVAISLAEKLGGEIISCDSMQVYRGMDIITRPPGEKLLSRVPHHLIKSISPDEEYSAARFVEEATRLIEDIISRKKTPVIAGGTGLYMKSLIDGLFSSPPKDEDLRKELEEEAHRQGNEALYKRLEEVDPGTASALHPNDLRRVIRALEVYELSGETIHEKKKESSGIGDKYDCKIFGMDFPREVLYGRINETVDQMFSEGLVEEVKRLREQPLSKTAGKALGIKEVCAFLDGREGFDEMTEELKKNTRKYAKRQLTWFRADERVEWVDANRDVNDITGDILGRL